MSEKDLTELGCDVLDLAVGSSDGFNETGNKVLKIITGMGYQVTKTPEEADKQYSSWTDVPDDLKQIVECLDSWPENNPTGVYLADRLEKGMADRLGKVWARTFNHVLKDGDFTRSQFDCAKSLKPDSKFEVGQMVIVEDDGDDAFCPRVAKFLGKEARVIGICSDIEGNSIVTVHHETLGYLSLQEHAFLKARTEEEKLLDEADDILKDYSNNNGCADDMREAARLLIAAGWRPNN